MSIIERVADLLESVPQPQRKPPAAGREAGPLEPNRIERAAGDMSLRIDSAGDKDLAAESKTWPALPADTTARIHRIDPERLRRQSMITPDGERTPIAEGFRRIKRRILTNVDNPRDGVPANLVLVTSSLAGEGKTFCAINLAISIALEIDHTVLLVDADVAKPSIPQALGLEAEKGLMDVLLDRRIDLAEVLCRTDIGKLTLLPAGAAHRRATELLASEAMRELLQEMAARYHDRIIIFDSPPLLAASEAGVLASRMGQIVMVVEAGKTTEATLRDALGRIESSNVAGLLLNKGEGSRLGYYYGGYGQGAK
ncbi:MAG: XrtA-associated tyrosine autokinase [Burkholderiales bacterium]